MTKQSQDDPFQDWPSIIGVVFGSLLAGLVLAAWVLIHRDAGFAAAGKPVAQEPRFAVSALLVKAIPTGINYELELGVLNAADAQDARAKFSVYVKGKNPGHELKDVMAMAVQQGG